MNPAAGPHSFDRYGPAVPTTPLVISVPHAGRTYPAELIAASRLRVAQLEALEDRFVDRLVGRAVADGGTVFVARHARAWIDLNRDERELDAAMVTPAPSDRKLLSTVKLRGGLGLIPRRIAGDGEIYRQPLPLAAVDARIARDHRPWHAAIAAALAAARTAFGTAVLLDCHSMPALGGSAAPRLVIGDRFGRSAAARFVDRVAEQADRAQLHWARNTPYAGGYTLDRHGEQAAGIHAVQIEIDRSLYLAPDGRTTTPATALIDRFVGRIAQALADEALSAPTSLAAE